jgi:hypothetical protein
MRAQVRKDRRFVYTRSQPLEWSEHTVADPRVVAPLVADLKKRGATAVPIQVRAAAAAFRCAAMLLREARTPRLQPLPDLACGACAVCARTLQHSARRARAELSTG